MIQCPNCGGAVVFDIASQQMKCQSCSSAFSPYDFKYGNGAEETTEYDVTVFKCPQCGGEIASTDETAAAFCSYCGSSNVLESRISREKRPQLIIPFKQTKQQCKELFAKRVGKAMFAPADYKNCKIESFRGIYMPYWLYDMSVNGSTSAKSSTSHRSGDYIITDHYSLSGHIQAVYNGVSYDASSTFADDISNEIAPYNVKDITGFTPAFLSGYYADIADVPASTYTRSAQDLGRDCADTYLRKKTPFGKESLDGGISIPKPNINVQRSAMFPVWFMSYRRGNRVAYATVNGQTGKVSADIPVSIPKYIVCALIMALVSFPILQFILTVTPHALMILFSIISVIVACMYNGEMKKILSLETHDSDLGYLSRVEKIQNNRAEAQKNSNSGKKKNKKKKKDKFLSPSEIVGVIIFIVAAVIACGGLSQISKVASGDSPLVRAGVILLALAIIIAVTVSANKKIAEMQYKNGFAASSWTCLAVGILFLISVINPVGDIYYYIAIAIAIAGVLITLIDMMLCFNLMAMRPLPQFEMYQGGDDRA